MAEIKKDEIIEEYLRKSDEVDYSIRLPDTEFDVMQAVWSLTPPVTTGMLMKKIGDSRKWKTPTLISFLIRLEERGFIISYKNGKERYYIPIAEQDIYLSRMTEQFVEKLYGGSLTDFLDSLYREKKSLGDDIDELLEWIKSRYNG